MKALFALGISLALAGCSLFGTGSDGGTTSNGNGRVGFGAPTLQLTVGGVRFGPAAPDQSSSGSLTTTRDTAGQVSDSSFRLGISSAAIGAGCQLALDRFGTSIAPFTAGSYTLADPGQTGTADGTASPIGSITVSAPQGTWQCAGSACNGGALVLSVLAADHVEGYLSVALSDTSGDAPVDVICAFYVPMSSFSQ